MTEPATQIPNGRFVWYDLMTNDLDGATKFYGDVVGWGTQAWEESPSGQPYTMWMNGETSLGGLMALPDEAQASGTPPHWIAYVAVPDCDATLEKVQELGGNILVPGMDIPTVGRFGVFADPQGAVLAAYTPAGEAPGSDQPGVGHFSWHELATSDYKAASEFYSAVFGWQTIDEMDMGEGAMYSMFGRTDIPTGGMFNKPDEMPVSAWLYYISVEDIDATVAKVTAAGGKVFNGPMEVPGGGRVAQCMDAQGAAVAMYQPPAEG